MVNTGRQIQTDKTKEEVEEKLLNLIGSYNESKKELDPGEINDAKKKIWKNIAYLKDFEREAYFEFMDGSKTTFRKEFASFCREYFSEDDTQKDITEKYNEEVIQEAEKMLDEKHILKYVKTVLDHKIAGEDRNKVALFLQLLTKDFEEPLMIFGVQKQGEGKSFLLKRVLDLFPDNMVEDLTDATKASIYRIAEDEGKNYFKDKIVYFGEIPEDEDDREVFQLFRQLVSEGEVTKRLTMDRGNGLESHELELEGAPCMATTTTDPDRIDKQDLSRGVTFSPSMSDRQYEAVREYQNREEELPEDALEPESINELERKIKCAVEMISENDVKVRNPFARDIDELVPDRTDNIKRDYKKVLRIVGRVPAYLYYKQRPEIESNGETYKLTTWKDIVRGLWINKDFINGMLEGRVKATLDVLQKIKSHVEPVSYSYKELQQLEEDDEEIVGESFTNQDVEKWTGINSDTVYNYTRELEKLGFIYKDKRSRPNAQYLVDDGKTKNGGITPAALKVIIEAFIEAENVRNWADFSLKFYNFQGDSSTVLDKIGLSKGDIPENEELEIDLGLSRSKKYPTPVYMQDSRIKSEVANSLIFSKDDANITLRFAGVSKTFTLFEDDESKTSKQANHNQSKDKNQEKEDLTSDVIVSDLENSTEEEDDLIDGVPDKTEIKQRAEKLSGDDGFVDISGLQDYFRQVYEESRKLDGVLDPENEDAGIGKLIDTGSFLERDGKVKPL